MSIKAVLFDIDGTLIDSNDWHVAAWDEAFRGHGFTIDRAAIHDQIGKGGDILVPSLIPDADDGLTETLSDGHGEIFKQKYLERMQPFPDARELLLHAHRAGQKVVLASSASKGELEHYLDFLGIRDIVAASTTIDDVESSKPAPDIFAVALKKVAPLQPAEAMVVGDTPYDVEAAAKCGMRTIALRSGKFPDEALLRAGAVALFDDAAALLAGYGNSPLGR